MTLSKTTYRDRSGVKRQSSTWSIRFADHRGQWRRLAGFKDRKATEALERQIKRLAALRGAGEPADPAMARWIDNLPERIVERLAAFDLLDAERMAVRKLLSGHLDDWAWFLESKGNTATYVKVRISQARRVIEGCRFTVWSDMSASKTMNYLRKLQQEMGVGARSFNAYLSAIKSFCHWMVADGRAKDNPLAYLSKLNERTDKRRKRRALEPDEISWLLHVTSTEPKRHGMPGPERSLLYRLAIESGLRVAELKSLTRESFNLDGPMPNVSVAAAYSKHRRDDTIPLRAETIERLKGHLARKMPKAEAFTMPGKEVTAKMLRADLSAARKAWLRSASSPGERQRREKSSFLLAKDSTGRVVDFHALRHTCGSLLAQSGIHPKVAQSLMRHSTITLTMDRYTHTLVGQDAEALAKLPDFAAPVRHAGIKTGTDNTPAELARNTDKTLTINGASNGNSLDHKGVDAQEADTKKTPANIDDNQCSQGSKEWLTCLDSNQEYLIQSQA